MEKQTLPILPTTVVGSYPQPDWLIDREALRSRLPARIRAADMWRISEPYLEQAQDDATIIAIRAMEQAGVDIVSDGEARRESYSNRFSTALGGVDPVNPGHALSRRGLPDLVPLFIGLARREHPIQVRDVQFLRANTDRPIKITIPGAFTMSQQAVDEHYHDPHAFALALAAALNEELLDLQAAGADVLHIDEPYMQARVEQAREFAVEVINRSLRGVTATTVLHTCFGYGHYGNAKRRDTYEFLEELADSAVDQISVEAAQPGLDLRQLGRMGTKTMMVGVIDLGSPEVETPEVVAGRIRAILQHLPPERLVIAPDCGMKYLDRGVAYDKLSAMVAGTRIVRRELGVG